MRRATTNESVHSRADGSETEWLRDEVSHTIKTSHQRLSTRDVLNRFCGPDAPARMVRQVINHLVADGDLRYVNDSGISFLEPNYAGRFQLSDRVWMLPPMVSDAGMTEDAVAIRIAPGAAFGDCRHPTTRLSVRAIDFLLTGKVLPVFPTTGLDIGTGSGILAITAARLGVEKVTAIDNDPCARAEARKNIRKNGLVDRITVSDSPASAIPSPIALVMANLRLPTLKAFSARIIEMLSPDGAAVFSGMEEEAAGQLLSLFQDRFHCVWHETENGWAALVLTKTNNKATE
ncbi:MAG: 50S ribosomal protein L11 methyltransferase [Thermodesulfobacteriota bacterium]|nr:50S ribosomal protein L11 methyltransferase [Thermodesulfobacteriota bacterium]